MGLWLPFKYCGIFGYREDEEIRLMKVGARFYDPFIGRWIQKDPILDGFNWFVYCDNDPVNRVDPKGLFFAGIADLLKELITGLLEKYGLLPTALIVATPVVLGIIALHEIYELIKLYEGAFIRSIYTYISCIKGALGITPSPEEMNQSPPNQWKPCCYYCYWHYPEYWNQYWYPYICPPR
ncbi:RHS repeat-associated core domain-containing protein [bacterium]|nr:RHS repeat-associated core domain-containing protein [bacterium]